MYDELTCEIPLPDGCTYTKCVEIKVNPQSDTDKEPIADVVDRIEEIKRLNGEA